MADHKFKIGQAVLFRPKQQLTLTPLNGRPCRVIQILPAMNGEVHYRIRSVQTEHEIAASESELRRSRVTRRPRIRAFLGNLNTKFQMFERNQAAISS